MITGTIVGRLGRDPETRTTASGKTVTSANVAVDHGWGDRKSTTWVRCSIWNKRGEAFAAHHSKGDGVELAGVLYTREHEGKTYLECDVSDWSFLPRTSAQDTGQQRTQAPPSDDIPF